MKGKRHEIKDSRDSGRKMLHHINKLRGRKKNGNVRVYDENGNEMGAEELKNEMANFRKGIYQMHNNDVREVWNDITRGICAE